MDESILTEDFNNYKSEKKNLTWFKRTFTNIESGSVRTGIFSLITTAVGSGILNLPRAIYKWDIYWGILMIFVGAINLYISSKIFSDLIPKHKKNKIYPDLVNEILGKKMAEALNFIFLFYVWGSIIGYMLICKNLWVHVCRNFIYKHITTDEKAISAVILYLIVFLAFPLSLKKTTGSLKKYTIIGFIMIILYVFVVLFQFIFVFTKKKRTFNDEPSINDKLNSFGIYFYSFNFIVNIFTVRDNLVMANDRRLRKTFYRTLIIIFILYSLSSITAYYSVGDDLKNIILFIERPFENDWLMKVISIGLIISNGLGLIIHVIPIKFQLQNKLNFELDKYMNILLTILILFLPLFLSILFDKVDKVFGIIGAFFAISIITTFPCLMAFKYYKTAKRYFYLVWGIIITLCGYVSGVYGIIYFND